MTRKGICNTFPVFKNLRNLNCTNFSILFIYMRGRPGVQYFLFPVVETSGKAEQNCVHLGTSLAIKTV